MDTNIVFGALMVIFVLVALCVAYVGRDNGVWDLSHKERTQEHAPQRYDRRNEDMLLPYPEQKLRWYEREIE